MIPLLPGSIDADVYVSLMQLMETFIPTLRGRGRGQGRDEHSDDRNNQGVYTPDDIGTRIDVGSRARLILMTSMKVVKVVVSSGCV